MSGERQIQVFAAGQGEKVDDRGLLPRQPALLLNGEKDVGGPTTIGDEDRTRVGRALGAGRILIDLATGDGDGHGVEHATAV
jgi:hypothetical protein